MDANVKKTVLWMIPYGFYVLTAKGKDGTVAAATVNWEGGTAFKFFKPGLAKTPEGRADDAPLWLRDLGANIFYGG
jgi:hypothetical protein